jgi:hypothetical protein
MAHIHVEKWVERALPDYYMLFIKAWIPFNAWYKRECKLAGVTNLSDKSCINWICNNPNTVYNKVISLLTGTANKDERFRDDIASLQIALKNHIIPSVDHPLNFSTMVPEITSVPLIDVVFRTYKYKVERITVGNSFQYDIRVEDNNTHIAKYTKHLNKWDLNAIIADSNYQSLKSTECKKKILEYFKDINPSKPLDIVLTPMEKDGVPQKPRNSIEMGHNTGVYFVKDTDKIAKVLIHLLYKLRCEIFHGSLDPSKANSEIYQYAYNIQLELVKELI